jgi:hypothetical protein
VTRQTWTNLGVAGLALVAVISSYLAFRAYGTADAPHGTVRQFVVQATLVRFPDAVVVLGDSIVELSTLPRSLCGHAIVNAGIGGTSTTSELDEMLARALNGHRAAMIILALGTNDAGVGRSKEAFASNYSGLLRRLSTLAARLVVVGIPLAEGDQDRNALINEYNAILPDIAKKGGAEFVPLPAMPPRHTLDSLHLDAAGYEIWDEAILRGAAKVCEPGSSLADDKPG